jgi:hypothetical protein
MLNHKWLSENAASPAKKKIPVLMVNTDDLNVAKSKQAQETLIGLVKKKLHLS